MSPTFVMLPSPTLNDDTVAAPVVSVELPLSMLPNPLVIEPLFNAPEVTRAESPLYAVASQRLKAGVASAAPKSTDTPPKLTESLASLALAIEPANIEFSTELEAIVTAPALLIVISPETATGL